MFMKFFLINTFNLQLHTKTMRDQNGPKTKIELTYGIYEKKRGCRKKNFLYTKNDNYAKELP